MGYFSNGSEGDWYREKWCDRCANDGDQALAIGCAVMDLHLLHNYEQFKNATVKIFLDALIPVDHEGTNQQCRMFRERTA